jgi:hypothetical protein
VPVIAGLREAAQPLMERPMTDYTLAYPAAMLPPILTRQEFSKYDSRSTPRLQQINQEY